MLKSLIEIRDELETIANDHRQINNFYWGTWVEAMKRKDDNNNRLYKYMIVTPGAISHNKKYTSLTIQISICDLMKKGYEDRDEIHSDCVQILNDIFITMGEERWNDFSDISGDGNTQLFVEKTLDGVAGATMTINLQVYSEDDSCAIPYENGTALT